ncbi:class I SAM-dependent methyltransferase [Paenibacillus sp. UMB4589-SE434]|uniref:tRNA (adenine(22)-N(1))-methyltransferase n=1 Tax=Paenibacillus sp. UMB4589-SE434 TaxID=3046314 RepID=UPI00254C3CFC|nr:class I SAM-dependent methyltransferase [Paenibacillus sp. UMB4589-SE434]MDK8180976.1 class I SAM-dependent methyltransferase [Paenibacillus sp. UMB4589-SE434]
MTIKLSKRLQHIADWVPAGSRLADIGSDHALLPTYLARSGRILHAIAGEVNPGPFDAAAKQVASSQLEHMVQVRRGDGLAVLQPGEVDCITIAGMGGSLIVSILSAEPLKLDGVRYLVLQPNVGEEFVRGWLSKNGWSLMKEQIIEEDGKIYEIMYAERLSKEQFTVCEQQLYAPYMLSCGIMLDETWLKLMGPHLVKNPSEVYIQKWQLELKKQERIIQTMANAETEDAMERRQRFVTHKAQLEAMLACWQKDKQ